MKVGATCLLHHLIVMQLQSKVLHYSLYLFKIIPCIAPSVNLYGFCESPDASCHHMPLSKSTPGPAGVTQHRTPFIRTAWTRHKLWRKGKEMLPVSQRLAPEHWLGARAIASQRPIGQNRREPASPASICSRLRCLSFQSTTLVCNRQAATKQATSKLREATSHPKCKLCKQRHCSSRQAGCRQDPGFRRRNNFRQRVLAGQQSLLCM